MKTLALFASLIMFAASVSAATIDFSGPSFANSFDGQPANLTVDGVNFSFAPVARGADGFRQSFDNIGLSFGIGGNGMEVLTITADTDVLLINLTGEDRSVDPVNAPATDSLPFDIFVGGTQLFNDAIFSDAGSSLSFGNTLLNAGTTFQIAHDLSNVNSPFLSLAVLGSIDFSVMPSPVAVSNTLPLLLLALGGLGFRGSRRKTV